MNHFTKKVKQGKPQSTLTATTRRPPTVDEFLKVNPLPAQLNHLEPSLRKLPSVSMLLEIMMGCLAYDMSNADIDRIVADVGDMFSQTQQRCAACLNWIDKKHTGSVAVYMPHDGRPHTGYAVCKRCAKLAHGTPEQQAKLTSQVETYLDGSAH